MVNKGLYTGNMQLQEKAQDLVAKLISGQLIWHKLRDVEIFSALFFNRNETLLAEMRRCFQEQLVKLAHELNKGGDSDANEKKLNQHICTLPLAEIKPGQKYLIPAFNGQKWELVTYKVTPIELTPAYGISRLVLADNDRFFAYGFHPELGINSDFKPPALLVFISPNYPAQQGFLANFYLRFQVTKNFYTNCSSKIAAWRKTLPNDNQIFNVHAIGQASVLSKAVLPNNDENIHYCYEAKESSNNLGTNIFNGIISLFLVMPCQYLLIPLIRAILNHIAELALLSILIMVFMMLPGLVMTDIGMTLAVFTGCYFGFKLIEPIKVIFNLHEKKVADCHITNYSEENLAEEYRQSINSRVL